MKLVFPEHLKQECQTVARRPYLAHREMIIFGPQWRYKTPLEQPRSYYTVHVLQIPACSAHSGQEVYD